MCRIYSYLLGICLFLLPLAVHAQMGEPRSNIDIGASVGLTMSSIGFDPTIKQKQLLAPTAGVVVRVTSEKYFKTYCALQAELNFVQAGWKEEVFNAQNQLLPDTYSRKLNYLQLPIMARLAWGKENRGFMGYFMAGPQLSICLSEKESYGSSWTLNGEGHPDRLNDMYDQYGMGIDHRFDYGITAGAGVELGTSAGRFLLDARYYYGLSDIFKNGKRDVFGRSNNQIITVKLTYLIPVRK